MRVFLDANVLFSAADRTSSIRVLFDMVARHSEMVTCPHAAEEARRNIILKRPRHSIEIERLLTSIEVSHAFSQGVPVHLPPEDMPILAGAMGSRSTHLWTGDKRHFGSLFGKTIAGVTVVNATMVLDIAVNHGWWKKP